MPVSIKHVGNDGDGDSSEGNEDDVKVRRGIISDEDIMSDREVETRLILQGLVLRLSHAIRAQYQRVGTFTALVPKEVETIMQKKAPHLAETEYEAFDGNDQYTVSII